MGWSRIGSPNSRVCCRHVPEVCSGVTEPELPLPVTDLWWQPCAGLKSFLNGNVKRGEELGAFGLFCEAVLDCNAIERQGMVLNIPPAPCSPLSLVPVGPCGGTLGTAVTLHS